MKFGPHACKIPEIPDEWDYYFDIYTRMGWGDLFSTRSDGAGCGFAGLPSWAILNRQFPITIIFV